MNVVFRIVMTIVIALVGYFSLIPMPVQARTVRVGWYLLEGMQEYDTATGLYGGYNFAYLRTIAQYTDWDYEFVILPFNECMTGYLTKPVQPHELLQALRDILDTSPKA